MNVGDKVTVNTKLVSGNGTIKSLFSKRRDYAMVVLESNKVCCVALEYLIPSPNGGKPVVVRRQSLIGCLPSR